jgi:ATP-dependent phosphofructokinase / diphosphate-dependent phosphofructokinase
MNLAHRLALLVSDRLKIRARSEKPGLLGRATSAYVSQVDWQEARLCGKAAVRAAAEGAGGQMVTLLRDGRSPYAVKTGLVELERVAFVERPFPQEWRNAEGNGVLSAFREYAAPLIGEISPHETLQAILIPKRAGLPVRSDVYES